MGGRRHRVRGRRSKGGVAGKEGLLVLGQEKKSWVQGVSQKEQGGPRGGGGGFRRSSGGAAGAEAGHEELRRVQGLVQEEELGRRREREWGKGN